MTLTGRRLRTPRAAAVAGIAFALLLGTSYMLIRLSIPLDPGESQWLAENAGTVRLALGLIPFAGIAFLWFMGVVRDRIGDYEDRFFSTVFFGSGLLFLAMVFVSAATAGSLLVVYAEFPDQIFDTGIYIFGRDLTNRISSIYSMRMAAVFMLSLATIGTQNQDDAAVAEHRHLLPGTRPPLRDQREPLGVPRLPGVGPDALLVLPHRRRARPR